MNYTGFFVIPDSDNIMLLETTYACIANTELFVEIIILFTEILFYTSSFYTH